jgi:integrase
MNARNIQLRYDYQNHLHHGEGADAKTLDEVLRAIAEFEDFTNTRDFGALRKQDVIAFKRHLHERPSKADGKPLSASTITHKLRHLGKFFTWVKTRPGYSKLDADAVSYFTALRKEEMAARSARPRVGPELEDVLLVLETMPVSTVLERRNRAVIATLLLTGVRDAALVSLRHKHIDLVHRRLDQDGGEVDTKFGKSMWTAFFIVPEEVYAMVEAWVDELDTMGFGSENPLFPREAKPIGKLAVPGTIVREFWTTAGPVRKIVKQACKEADVPYFVPHSLRKTLTRLGFTRCRTIEEMKAWSQNLGHKSLETTMTSYGTLSEERKCQLIDGLKHREASEDLKSMIDDADSETQELVRLFLLKMMRS